MESNAIKQAYICLNSVDVYFEIERESDSAQSRSNIGIGMFFEEQVLKTVTVRSFYHNYDSGGNQNIC